MNIEKIFGEELQKIRKEKGLSQEQLGFETGSSASQPIQAFLMKDSNCSLNFLTPDLTHSLTDIGL